MCLTVAEKSRVRTLKKKILIFAFIIIAKCLVLNGPVLLPYETNCLSLPSFCCCDQGMFSLAAYMYLATL